MYQILKPKVIVHTETSEIPCEVEQYLGGGGQGEVYRARLGSGKPVALKWYYPHYVVQDERLRERLKMAISGGAPSDRFLWPLDFASSPDISAFGYIMPLR